MPTPSADAVFTPSQLNALARSLLEDTFPLITVEGELGNVARPSSGHLYCTIKDARAQVRCALFKPKSTWLRFQPRDGLQVRVRGRLTLYEPRGEYQMVLDHMEEAGEGALRQAYEQLKRQLHAEGLFDAERKRPVPPMPRRIGVLTSPTGAAVRDVLSVLSRRFPLVQVDVLPVPVQGATAAAQIRGMLARANAAGLHDVLLLTRGGGSLEDLWAFNDEHLVRAVAASAIPLVCAVGHEIDISLCDLAADLRAATPSAAAEMLVPDRLDLLAVLRRQQQRLHIAEQRDLQQRAQRLDRAMLRLQSREPGARLQTLRQRQQQAWWRLRQAMVSRLQTRTGRLRDAAGLLRLHDPQRQLQRLRDRLQHLHARSRWLVTQRLQTDTQRLRGSVRALASVSPLATLARGYAIVQHPDGSVLRSSQAVSPGDALQALLHDGRLHMRVERVDAQAADTTLPATLSSNPDPFSS